MPREGDAQATQMQAKVISAGGHGPRADPSQSLISGQGCPNP
jgi:hypothetical protein